MSNNNFTPFTGPSRRIREEPTRTETNIVPQPINEQVRLERPLIDRLFRRGSGSNSSPATRALEQIVDVETNLRNYQQK